jgi:hypothetical protein
VFILTRKSLKVLLLSTFLFSSAGQASYPLSDAYNGLVDEKTRQDPTWHRQALKQFQEREIAKGELYEAVERFFAPYSRKGSEDMRNRINALCDYLNEKYKEAYSVRIIFEGHLGDPNKLPQKGAMKDVPEMGKRLGWIRKKDALQKELEEMREKAKVYPQAKEKVESALHDKQRELQALEGEIQTLQNQLQGTKAEYQTLNRNYQELSSEAYESLNQEERKSTPNSLSSSKNSLIFQESNPPDEASSKLTALNQSIEKLALEIENKRKQQEASTTQKQTLQEELNKLEQDYSGYPRLCEELEQEIKSLNQDIILLSFMKYLSWLNIYSALPNPEFSYYGEGEGEKISLIPHELYPAILSHINSDISEIMKKIVSNACAKKTKAIFSGISKKLPSILKNTLQNQPGYNHDDNIGKKIDQLLREENFKMELPSAPTYLNFDSLEPGFLKKFYKGFNPDSPITFVQDKIAKYSSELVRPLQTGRWEEALRAGLLNSHYSNERRAEMISVEFLESIYDKQELTETSESMQRNRDYWGLGSEQVRVTFFDSYYKANEPLPQTMIHLRNFVESKVRFKGNTLSNQEYTFKGGNPQTAFFKLIAYSGMAYVLHYSPEGKVLPPLKFFDESLSPYIQGYPEALRLDKVMAVKVGKWRKHFLNLEGHENFLEKYGLKSHTFAKKDK